MADFENVENRSQPTNYPEGELALRKRAPQMVEEPLYLHAIKVLLVEGENMINGIKLHHGDKTRIKNLDLFHTVLSYDSLPLRVNTRNIRKQMKYLLNNVDFP